MVSALDSGSRSLGSWPGRVIVLYTHSVSLHPGVLENCQESLMKCLRVTLGWTGIPYRGEWWYSLSLNAIETGILSSGLSTDFTSTWMGANSSKIPPTSTLGGFPDSSLIAIHTPGWIYGMRESSVSSKNKTLQHCIRFVLASPKHCNNFEFSKLSNGQWRNECFYSRV